MLFDDPPGSAGTPLLRELWPHQQSGIDRVQFQIAAGVRRICLQCPTGGGKTEMVERLARSVVSDGGGVTVYTNRRMLMDQLYRDFTAAGVPCGVRAPDVMRETHHPVQVCMAQTDHSRVIKRRSWDVHESSLVVIDEGHVNNNPTMRALVKRHLDNGAAVLWVTATPVGLADVCDVLVQCGPTSELRACGALVPAVHYGCDEPDLRHIKTFKSGAVTLDRDLSETEQRKAIMTPGVFGRVLDWFRITNPQGLPSIGFAPGVGESIGFMESFNRAGIPAAHIDGDEIIFPGANGVGIRVASDATSRARLAQMSREGDVRVVWNRFVLREGISWNWLAHGIFACVFGTLQSYIQSGGRLLRAHPGLERVTVQDHGGNWWRHGSLNADREWSLEDTHASIAHSRYDLFDPPDPKKPKEPQPFLCPNCRLVYTRPGNRSKTFPCPHCGGEIDLNRRARFVIQANGEPVEMPGTPYRIRTVDNRPETLKLWRSIYFRARQSKSMTFKQAVGLFAMENGYRPPATLELMPVEPADWYRKVSAVPPNRLRQAADKKENGS